jgi:hypothetical protein
VGALIVRDGQVIAEAGERVDSALDIAGHAEVIAIRLACEKLGSLDLTGCSLYTSAEPCVRDPADGYRPRGIRSGRARNGWRHLPLPDSNRGGRTRMAGTADRG